MATANGKRRRVEEADSSDRAQGLRDLAQAIRRLGEAYERVESAKREQELRMERDRLDAAREMEDERVQFFLKMQIELSKANSGAPSATVAMVGNSAAIASAADGNGTRRTATATDVATGSNHHVRYRVKDGRHRQALQHPHYQQYNQNNVGAATTHTENGSDTDNKEDDEEMEEEESQ